MNAKRISPEEQSISVELHCSWQVVRWTLVCLVALLGTTGCGAIATMARHVFVGPEVNYVRQAPATEDLPDTTTLAITHLKGKDDDVNSISGHLGTWLAESGRFQVLEREQLQALATENDCDVGDMKCLASVLPASAMVVGEVTGATYKENVSTETYDCKKDGKNAKCISKTRKGTARVAANLRLVETRTGRVLYQKMLNEERHDQTSASDGDMPEALDADGLIESGRVAVALAFFEAISPHKKTEVVGLESDGDIPQLDRGNNLIEAGEYLSAIEMFKQGVTAADANQELDPDERGKAYYNLGVAQAMNGDYDASLENLRKATGLDPDDDQWATMMVRVSTWKGEAAAVERQLAFAAAAQAPMEPPAPMVAEAETTEGVASDSPSAGATDEATVTGE